MAVRRDERQWRYRKVVKLPDGRKVRVSGTPALNTRQAAEEAERAHILQLLHPSPPAREAPTLIDFKEQFLDHLRGNHRKPSTIYAAEVALDAHILPLLGRKRLDAVVYEDVEAVKAGLAGLKRKSVNNVLTILSVLLKYGQKLGLVGTVPPIDRLRVGRDDGIRPDHFYTFDEYHLLINAAARIDPRILAVVLCAGDAGLRASEIIALEWRDVGRAKAELRVERADWYGKIDSPKSGSGRTVPMTPRLAQALKVLRHLRSERVFVQDDGSFLTRKVLRRWMASCQRLAQVKVLGRTPGNIHILRHTFCSHLAMRGAPALAIKELAGHAHLSTTMRYMHLQAGAKEAAIALLGGMSEAVSAAAAGVPWQPGGNATGG
jgi:integrase